MFSLVLAIIALCLAVPAGAQETRTLKMQSTWPASLTLQDNFKFFAERVDKLTGGQLKIEALAAGQVVPPFEVLDATHKKVIDGAHAVSYYWVGKNKAATLFSATPAGIAGMDQIDFIGWLYEGGGLDLWWEFYQKELQLNLVVFPILPASPQALGWFKQPIRDLDDFKGMKCRQTGIVAEIYQRMGMQTVNLPGGEIIPSAQRGVIDCAEWVGGVEDLQARPAAGVEVSLHAGHARERLGRRDHDQLRGLGELAGAAAGGDPVGRLRDFPALVGQVAASECRCDRGNARQVRRPAAARAARCPDRVFQGLGGDRGGRIGQEPVLQEGARTRSAPTPPRSSRPSASCSRHTRSRPTTSGLEEE